MYVRGLYLSVLLPHVWSVSRVGEVGSVLHALINALAS